MSMKAHELSRLESLSVTANSSHHADQH